MRTLVALTVALAPLLAACLEEDVPPAPSEEPRFALEAALGGLDLPLFAAWAADAEGALFIVEQEGRILRWDGAGAPVPFLDLTDRVRSGGERGLLGLAFDPDLGTRRFYVHYTDLDGDTVLSRFSGPAAVEEILLQVDQPYENHNGGMVAFGPDGHLYLALGDGGAAGDPGNRAQDKENILGKLLRLDVSSLLGYRIPADNPFVDAPGRDEVWAYGLRNPWRFSFDRATGDLWVGDVGQARIEEVDFQPAGSGGGENYGWNWYEGSQRYRASGTPPPTVRPVAQYDHDGGHCSVTGGYVYRGGDVPSLGGTYLFADYCSGQLWTVRMEDGDPVTRRAQDTALTVSSFAEDADGELYVIDHQGGALWRVVAA